MKSNYKDDMAYNFCSYRPPDDKSEKFILAWGGYMVGGGLGKAAQGGGVVIKGAAFAGTAGTAASDTIKKVQSKWPGERYDADKGSYVVQAIELVWGGAQGLWDFITKGAGFVGDTASWFANGFSWVVQNPVEAVEGGGAGVINMGDSINKCIKESV